MRRQIGILIFIAHMSFFTAIQVFGQQPPGQQNPSIPDDVLGLQLIAWSQLQKPEPVMQGQSQEQQQSLQRSDQPSSPVQTFSDRISIDRANQDGNRFIPSLMNGVNESVDTRAKY